MPDKKIMFVGNSSSFISNTIIKVFEENEYKIFKTNYIVNEIDVLSNSTDIIILVLDNEKEASVSLAATSIKDICDTDKKKVILVGDDNSIAKYNGIIGDENILISFKRPINPKTMFENVNNLLANGIDNKTKKEILVVDDSGTILLTVKKILEPKYKVAMVNSAINGMSYLGKHIPDLILLDYEMPVCNGAQMLEMLKADVNYSKIPVFFLTGKDDRESISRVLGLKPQGYLLKSLPGDKIIEYIDNFFAKL